jgi:hypothetical protein
MTSFDLINSVHKQFFDKGTSAIRQCIKLLVKSNWFSFLECCEIF